MSIRNSYVNTDSKRKNSYATLSNESILEWTKAGQKRNMMLKVTITER